MKLILGIILLLVPFILCKESVDDLVQLLEDPEILQEIVKRLGSENHEKSVVDDVDSCKYNNFTKTIIQTKASTAAGAAYLDSQVGVASNLECVNKCCHLDGCELAVYENKKERNCYLFRCKDVKTDENYCQFASHDDYISTSVTHNIEVSHQHDSNVNDHENDLQGLSDKVTTTTTTTETPDQPNSVSVGGKCRHLNACEDSHAYCLNGVCSCVTSYYNKQGTCREVCGPSRFECRVVDLDGPDCVRRSLVCDGSNDCYDGSDEVNCQKHGTMKNTKPIDTHFTHEKDIKHIDDDNVTSNSKITGTKTSKGKDGTTQDQSTDVDTLKSQDKSKSHDNSKSHDKSKSHHDKSKLIDKSKPQDTLKSDGTDSLHNKDKSKESKEDTSDKNKSNGVTSDMQKLEVSTSKPSPDHTGISQPAEINIQENHESLVVTKEKVYLTESFKMAQGPIIALSLGLAFTFLLLVFIGCRLRNIKRRLRKGRILHSNEADYLINGMYL